MDQQVISHITSKKHLFKTFDSNIKNVVNVGTGKRATSEGRGSIGDIDHVWYIYMNSKQIY
jgi:hypothetical protein